MLRLTRSFLFIDISGEKYNLNKEKDIMDLTKNNIDATLVFLIKKDGKQRKTLLAQKVRGLIVGCFNGFGGSINKKETPRTCAVRELRKESGLIAMKRDFEFMGRLIFHNKRKKLPDLNVRVYIFILKKWVGKLKLKEDEMVNPKWYKTYRLPLKKMAPGDRKFVPKLLDGEHEDLLVRGEIWYSEEQKKLLRFKIEWVGRTGDVD